MESGLEPEFSSGPEPEGIASAQMGVIPCCARQRLVTNKSLGGYLLPEYPLVFREHGQFALAYRQFLSSELTWKTDAGNVGVVGIGI